MPIKTNIIRTSSLEKQRDVGFTFLVLAVLLVLTNFYSFVGINQSQLVLILKPLFQLLFIYFLYLELKTGRNKKKIFTYIIFGLIFIPFFGFFSAKLLYNQSFIDSYRVQLDVFAWSFYFLWHRLKINIKPIIYAFTIFSLGYVFIQIYQNISGIPIFGPWIDVNGDVSLRNNLVRFYISSPIVIYFTQLFYFNLFFKSYKFIHLFLGVLFLVSIYLMLTRQVLVSALICNVLLIIFNLKHNKAKSKYIYTAMIVAIVATIITTYSDSLFSFFINATKDDLNAENVRLGAYTYFWDKVIQNPYTFFFGNGMPAPNGTDYSKLIINLWNSSQIGVADIGFVGYWFYYGAGYILVFIYIAYVVFSKYAKVIPFYVKMFVLLNYLQVIMVFPFRSRSDFVVWSLIFYIIDIYITNIKSTKSNRVNKSLS